MPNVTSENPHTPVRELPTLPLSPPPLNRPLPAEGEVEIRDLDALFKGLADPVRIRILNVLAAGELCVCDIVDVLGLPQPTVSRHLSYLRRSGLVTATREWKFAHYRLAAPDNAVHRTFIECVRACFAGVPALDGERAEGVKRAAYLAAEPR